MHTNQQNQRTCKCKNLNQKHKLWHQTTPPMKLYNTKDETLEHMMRVRCSSWR
jgi:hypothetical protein